MRTLPPAATKHSKHSEIMKWAENVSQATLYHGKQNADEDPPPGGSPPGRSKTRCSMRQKSSHNLLSGTKLSRSLSVASRPSSRKNSLALSPPPTAGQSDTMPKFPRLSSPEKQQGHQQQPMTQQQQQSHQEMEQKQGPIDAADTLSVQKAVEKAACDHLRSVDGCQEENPLDGIFKRRKPQSGARRLEFAGVQIHKLPEIVQLIWARKRHLQEQQKKKEEELMRQQQRQQQQQAEEMQRMEGDHEEDDGHSDINDVRSIGTSMTSSTIIRLPRSRKGSTDLTALNVRSLLL